MQTSALYRRDVIALILLLALAGAVIWLTLPIPYEEEPYARWDLHHYREMAQASPGLAPGIREPFAYRILGPWLAGLLPLSDPQAFCALTIGASLACVALFYLFLRSVGLSIIASAVSVALFICNFHFFGFVIFDFFQLHDMMALCLLVIGLWALLRRRWWVLGFSLLVGALTREAVMLLVPVTLFYLWDSGNLEQDGRAALLASLPGVLLFVSLRLLIHAPGRGLIIAFLGHGRKMLRAESWYALLISSFVPLTLLPLVYLDHARAFLRRRRYLALLAVLVFLSTFFGSNNQRLMAPAFIVFYWFIGEIIERDLQRSAIMLTFLVLVGFIAGFDDEASRFALLTQVPRRTVEYVAMGAVGLAAFLHRRRHGVPPP